MAAETTSSSAAVAVLALTAEELTLTVKWSGKESTVRFCGDDTVGELKRRICEVTNVLAKRQKLLYPKSAPSSPMILCFYRKFLAKLPSK